MCLTINAQPSEISTITYLTSVYNNTETKVAINIILAYFIAINAARV